MSRRHRTKPRPLSAALRGDQFKPTVILFTAPVLMLTWLCFGSTEFYLHHLAPRLQLPGDPAVGAALHCFVSCFVLLGVIPALMVKLLFRERLADYGVQLGDGKRVARSLLICAPVMILIAYVASRSPAVLEYYPINRVAGRSPGMFGFHACTYILFYIGWEFYFRGFMQCGLRDKLGAVNALGVQVLASTLLHIGKPWNETFGAIAIAIFWGILVMRTRSLIPCLAQHVLIGLSLDLFICYG